VSGYFDTFNGLIQLFGTMKFSLYFITAFFAGLFTLQAQTVTQENLQGRWDVIFIEANGISIDLLKKTYTVSDEVKEEYADGMGMIELGAQQLFKADFRFSMEFHGDSATLVHEGQNSQTKSGTYVIEPGTPQRLTITYEDGEKKTEDIAVKDGNLEFKDAGGKNLMIFKKTE
jgi:hypothetical protein